MSDKRQWIPLGGLLATMAIVIYTVVQIHAQETGAVTGDFTNAAVAEVRDAQGQVLLRGNFAPVEEADDDIERKAVLATAGVDPDAEGEAEVEFAKSAPTEQEVEFEVSNLEPGSRVTFVIDGRDVATVVTDKDGVAEFEGDIKMNAGTPTGNR
jgi:2,3-bisphosphoglycerate-independent phosphoglycerate mutase